MAQPPNYSPPQNGERFTQFANALGITTPSMTCDKATLVHMLHTITQLFQLKGVPTLAVVYYTQPDMWHRELQGYQASQQDSWQLSVLAGAPPPEHLIVHHLKPSSNDGSAQRAECVVVLRSPTLSFGLWGLSQQTAPAEPQQFTVSWSFALDAVNHMIDALTAADGLFSPQDRSAVQQDWAAMPLVQPDTAALSRFTQDMLRFQQHRISNLIDDCQTIRTDLTWHTTLIGMFVHDLRTPLQSIALMLEVIDTGSFAQNVDTSLMLDMAIQSAASLDTMIQTLLATQQLDMGTYEVQWQPIDLRSLLREAVEPYMILFEHVQLILVLVFADPRTPLWGDKTLLTLVLRNLIDYAVRYSLAGGTITLAHELSADDQQLIIHVSHTGREITPERLPHLFERQVRPLRQNARAGGPELYFCKLAMAAQHGSINAASTPNVDTTITISWSTHR